MFWYGWCGGLGAAGLVGLGLLWAAFLAVIVWAITRVFPHRRD